MKEKLRKKFCLYSASDVLKVMGHRSPFSTFKVVGHRGFEIQQMNQEYCVVFVEHMAKILTYTLYNFCNFFFAFTTYQAIPNNGYFVFSLRPVTCWEITLIETFFYLVTFVSSIRHRQNLIRKIGPKLIKLLESSILFVL